MLVDYSFSLATVKHSTSCILFERMDFTLSLPDWAVEEQMRTSQICKTVEERMNVVVRFSRLNIENNTGGPFAAAVFERDTGKLIIIGVNRVVDSNCSSAHAEIMALSLAQKQIG